MLIGHDVAGGIDDKARTETLQGLPNLPRPALIISKKLRVKVIKRIADGPADDAFGIDVYDGGKDLRHSQNRGFRRRISRWRGGGGLRECWLVGYGQQPEREHAPNGHRANSGERTRPR